jgi:hypothetical protein
MNKNKKHYLSIYKVFLDWRDYIRDCKKLGYDLNIEYLVFPKNLEEEHIKTIKLIKYKENEELDKKIKKRLKTLNKFYFEYKDLFIRPAGSTKELIEEGKVLHHCVGNYIKDYVEGRTNIFFIRKKEEPETPFYTVEIGKSWRTGDLIIRQCRSYKNTTPEENNDLFVKEFIEIFEKEIFSQNKILLSA